MKMKKKNQLQTCKKTLWITVFAHVFPIFTIIYMRMYLPIPKYVYILLAESMAGFFLGIYILSHCLDLNIYRRKIGFAFSPIISWLSIYTFIFLSIPHTEQNISMHAEIYVKYYQNGMYVSVLLMALVSFLSANGLNRHVQWIGKIIGSILTFFVITVPMGYLVYFMIYHSLFDDVSLMSILATNLTEAKEYLLTMFSMQWLILFLCVIFTSLLITWKIIFCESRNKINYSRYKRCILIFLIISMSSVVVCNRNAYFPFDIYKHLNTMDGGLMQVFKELKQNIDENKTYLKLKNKNTLASTVPGTVIVVIGESACRDHMRAFTREYSFDTTPWETAMRNSTQFVFFPQAYSNFPNTIMSLTQALTSANQYNGDSLGEATDIVNLAKKAGYHTYWFSAQNKNGVWDAGITAIANQADTAVWVNGKDDVLIDMLQSVPKNQNNFIVFHLMGSHYKYSDRISEKFANENIFNANREAGKYDTSIAFTDYILKEIFNYGLENLNLQTMIYFSDHDEDMKYKHPSHPFLYDTVRIPLWIYLSPEYVNHYPNTMKVLKEHSESVFTNDMMFETISGILHAESNYYNQQYDISKNGYSINWQTAKTMRGEILIADDPILLGNSK